MRQGYCCGVPFSAWHSLLGVAYPARLYIAGLFICGRESAAPVRLVQYKGPDLSFGATGNVRATGYGERNKSHRHLEYGLLCM
jgi:hypothetical protein